MNRRLVGAGRMRRAHWSSMTMRPLESALLTGPAMSHLWTSERVVLSGTDVTTITDAVGGDDLVATGPNYAQFTESDADYGNHSSIAFSGNTQQSFKATGISFSNPCTILFVGKSTASGNGHYVYDSTNGRQFALFNSLSPYQLFVGRVSGGVQQVAFASISPPTVEFALFTRSGSENVQVARDGEVSQDSGNVTFTGTTEDLVIGAIQAQSGSPYEGSIVAVGVYSSSLSNSEVNTVVGTLNTQLSLSLPTI